LRRHRDRQIRHQPSRSPFLPAVDCGEGVVARWCRYHHNVIGKPHGNHQNIGPCAGSDEGVMRRLKVYKETQQ
jgi:hypothetical protein